jgi:hypothetical protein
MFYWRVKLKRKINLTKGSKNKKYQKNDYQIEKKKHITNWDWRMKLKKKSTFYKEPRT